jgi:hypothetical protein
MKKYYYECDMASLKIMFDSGSIFFSNGFGDGVYEVYVCEEKGVPKKAEFLGHFTVLKKAWIMRYDCSNRGKIHTFTEGRYFVFRDNETCKIYIYKNDNEITC